MPVQCPEGFSDAKRQETLLRSSGTGRASAELKSAEARTSPRRIYGREAAGNPSKKPGTGRASAELKIGGTISEISDTF